MYASEEVRVALNPRGDYTSDWFGIGGRSIQCYPTLTGPLALSGRYLPASDYQAADENNRITIASASRIQASGVDKDNNGTLRLSDEKALDYEGLHIYPNADFAFRATEAIEFGPGFQVDAGATFEARIAACNPPARETALSTPPHAEVVPTPEPEYLMAQPGQRRDHLRLHAARSRAGEPRRARCQRAGGGRTRGRSWAWSGRYEYVFSTAQLPAGLYLYTLQAGRLRQTRRFAVVR